MERAKAKFGPRYHVAGADGVHPAANGHLIIAYAFLKALGCDGNIGTFTVDLAARRVTVSEGHRLLSFADDSVKIDPPAIHSVSMENRPIRRARVEFSRCSL